MPVEHTVSPMLSYEDVGAAADWLCAAFGLEELNRFADAEGRITHCVLALGDGRVHIGWPSPDYVGPRRHAETCEQARRWRESRFVVDGVLAYVSDLDVHFARARNAGARILSEPETGGAGRQYRAEDLEGHRWMFAQAAPAD
jgi:PhnB protein